MTPWDPTENGRYWVVGGGYTDLSFTARVWGEALGPFPTRYDAEACWRRLSFAHTHDARVRFTIVEEAHAARAA
ncbi:hypothetical protein LRS10_04150 [Phenylobacterium sp. J426]|uniref:DUF4170 domain-containing protein n=1 Tax=Phenylobacterium sp. J426 TaxID=2898439 RepID=UPI002151E99D|nr:hypothetical protein [Phenylobacterium sp. J426]MCR5873451.1 hypothetical protein [Phenylobacterium sp. J426]